MVTLHNIKIGCFYNWVNQPERLVYMGALANWHQFAKVESPSVVWCEVLASDLKLFEETPTVTKWVPESNPLYLRRLGKTLEELGELVAVLGRAVCQGVDGVDPASGENNLERMLKESADVLAQIGSNIEAFKLDSDAITERVAQKSRAMAEWEIRE